MVFIKKFVVLRAVDVVVSGVERAVVVVVVLFTRFVVEVDTNVVVCVDDEGIGASVVVVTSE